MPERVTVEIRSLPAGEYTAEVIARSFWGVPSENRLRIGIVKDA